MSSTLPPVLTASSISGTASHTVIDLTFSQPVEPGSGTIIVTDGALQTVIDRGTGLPTTRIVGATETHQIPLGMVGIDGNRATISVDGLAAGHSYRVFILPGALQTNGQPFAGVTSASQLAFKTPPAVDTTAPTLLQMSMDNYALTSSKGANLTLTFSESVSVDPAALLGPNVAVTGLSSSDGGITWHASVAANAGVEATGSKLTLDMSKVHDHANNAGSGTPALSYSIDTKAPTVTSIALAGASPVLASGATVTVTFSEKVDLSATAAPVIVAPNATVTNLHSSDGITWVANLVPQSGTLATGNQLYVDLGQVRDQAGNGGSGIANAPATYTVDTQGPGFKEMSLNGAILSQSRTIDVTIRMLQPVPSFDPAALSAPNATVTNLHTTDNGVTWIATLRPNSGTSVSHNSLSLDLSLLRNANGVAGSGVVTTTNAYSVDTVAPTATLALTGSQVSAQNSVTVTITFSETVQSLDPAAIKAPNVAVDGLSSPDGGRTWVAKLVPTTQSGTVSGNTVALDMSMVRDLAGNTGSGTLNSSTTYGVDIQPPTAGAIALSDSHVTSTTGPAMTVKFSEAVALDASAFTLPHAKLTGLHSADGGITWTGTVLADGSGNASGNAVSLNLGLVKDLYGNAGNGTVASTSYDVQVTAPTATITLGGNQVTKHTVVPVTVVFSQAVKSLDASAFSTQANIVVSGLASSDGGVTWTGTLTTTANIQAVNNVFSLDMSKVQDLFGNVGSGLVSASSHYDIDTVAPTATLALSTSHLTPTAPATLTITFSEPVTGLDISDFTVQHAQLSNLKTIDNGTTWQATLSASGGASASANQVSLDMTKVVDLSGNQGTTAPAVSYDVTYPVVQKLALSLDHTQLTYGGDIIVTMHFDVAVPLLDSKAITATNADVQHLHTEDGGMTWYALLAPQSAPVVNGSNVVSVDLSKVIDSTGAAGSGIVNSVNYSVDTTVSSYVQTIIAIDDNGPSMLDMVTNDNTPEFAGTLASPLASNQHVELAIDGTAVSGVTVSGNSWFYSPTIAPTQPDGAHTVTVRVVDDAGHASTQITKTMSIDTVAPLVTGTSIVGGSATAPGTLDVTKPLTISFSEAVYWHAVSHVIATTDQTVYRDMDNAVSLTDSAGISSWVYIDQRNLSSDGKTLTLNAADLKLAAGRTYTVALPQALTDLAGNQVSTSSFSLNATGTATDTAAPYALSAQVLDRAGDYGINKTIHLAVRFNEPVMLKSGATPYLSLNNGAQAVYSSISSDGRTLYYNYKISASDTVPTDNQYHWIELKDTGNLASSVTDLAGNALDAAHIQFTTLTNAIDPVPGSGVGIDVTPPAAINTPQLDPATDSGVQGDFITNGSAIFRGTGADAYAEINIYDTSGATPRQVGSSYADQGGNWTFYGYELTDGSYKLAATQLDHAGNESTLSGALPVVIDTFARQPTDLRLDAASDSGALGDMLTSNTTPVLVGSDAEHGAKVELYDGATLLGSAVADATGAWSVKAPALADGSHALSMKMTDIAGNQSQSSSFTLTIDTTAPAKLAKPTLDPSTDSGVPGDWITSYTAPKLTGSGAEAGAKVDVLEGTTVLGSATANSDGSWSLTLSTLAVGTHNLVLHQTDVAGNVSADTTVGLEIVNIVAVAPTTTFFFQPHLVL